MKSKLFPVVVGTAIFGACFVRCERREIGHAQIGIQVGVGVQVGNMPLENVRPGAVSIWRDQASSSMWPPDATKSPSPDE